MVKREVRFLLSQRQYCQTKINKMNNNNNTENLENKETSVYERTNKEFIFDFNRINFDVGDMDSTMIFAMQVVINAFSNLLERHKIAGHPLYSEVYVGSLYHRAPGYCDYNIEETGHNPKTGWVYIALESGVTLASNGKAVKYVATNWMTNKEYYFDSYDNAKRKWEYLQKWAKDVLYVAPSDYVRQVR